MSCRHLVWFCTQEMLPDPWFFILCRMDRQKMGNRNSNILRLQTRHSGQGASIQCSRARDGFPVALHKQEGFAETVDILRGMKLLQFSL